MKDYFLNLYSDFSCMAGACPDTCCSGWEIEISKEDYERFHTLEPLWLRTEILENVRERKGKFFFQNKKNGNCAMLLEDGLCNIEKHTSEQTLCNTCRKYPRIYGKTGEIAAFSMAASCPVVAEAIWENRLSVFEKGSGGLEKRSFFDVPSCGRFLLFFREQAEKGTCISEREEWFLKLSGMFEGFADVLLELLLVSNTFLKEKLLDLLSFYETEQTQDAVNKKIEEFYEAEHKDYERVKSAYVPYRIFGRQMEKPAEGLKEQYAGICGELFLFRFFGFLIYQKEGRFTKTEWIRTICLTYRLAAHEKKIGGGCFEFFQKRQDDIRSVV